MKEIFKKMWKIVKTAAFFVYFVWGCVVRTVHFAVCCLFVTFTAVCELCVGSREFRLAREVAEVLPSVSELWIDLRDMMSYALRRMKRGDG